MEAYIRWYAKWQRQNADALKEFLEKHKVNVLKTPPEILTEFLKTWDKIAAREAEKDPFFKKVLESQRQYAGVVVPAKRFLFPAYDFAANHYWPEKKAAASPSAPGAPVVTRGLASSPAPAAVGDRRLHRASRDRGGPAPS